MYGLLRPEWWKGYPAKSAPELAACLAAARVNRLPDDADARTPWERGEDHAIETYELAMIRRSADNMRALGLGPELRSPPMTKELSGKIAFVSGSGRGLGRVMAERLAELGADVAIHDLSWNAPAKYGEAADLGAVVKDLARHGGRVAAVTGNIGDKADGRGDESGNRGASSGRWSPRELRWRRHWRLGREAGAQRRARHPT